MTLDPRHEQLFDYITGRLTPEEHTAFLDAEAAAGRDEAAVRAEAEALRRLWDRLGTLPAARPSPELRGRFYAFLHEAVQGRAPRASAWDRFEAWLDGWWPRQPAVQFAFLVIGLLVGTGAGFGLRGADPAATPALAQMQHEVSTLRQMVTLSLLQQASAAERLRGIQWSLQLAEPDSTVRAALLNTLNYDPNVNVRLAAVDAFYRLPAEPLLQDTLVASLRHQQSPLVQLALIDLVVAVRAEQARAVLQQMADAATLAPEVRARAHQGLLDL